MSIYMVLFRGYVSDKKIGRMKIMKLNECVVKYGYGNMDFNKVTLMLSHAFWSEGIGIDEVRQGAVNSALLVGVFYKNIQVGYARVISDKTRFAYILDVYVDEQYRKMGIGQMMITSIIGHESLKDVYQWMLITRDAHGVYAKSGFKAMSNPESWMEIRHERPNR